MHMLCAKLTQAVCQDAIEELDEGETQIEQQK